MTDEKIIEALKQLTRWAENKVCFHDETHRGGAIWEICDTCGAKWADDEGGKPELKWPAEIESARAALSAANAAQVEKVGVTDEEWLISDGLVYSLRYGVNYYEINVSMAHGSRDRHDRHVLAEKIATLLRSTPQTPVKECLTTAEQTPVLDVADERAVFDKWHMRVAPDFRFYSLFNEIELSAAWRAWQARAALSQQIVKDEPVCLVAHPVAPGQRHDWREVSADRLQKFIDGGFVTRTLYTRPQPQELVSDAIAVPIATIQMIYESMNYMGDILNGMDAVEAEDEEKCAPAFDAIRALLFRRTAEGGGK